jgi:N-acetylmuramoyl-L-alanine amidase
MGFGLILMWSWRYNVQVNLRKAGTMGNPFGRLCAYLLLAASLLGSIAAPAQAAANASTATGRTAVTGVRAGNHGDTTRFVIDLNRSVNFRVFTLANPYRVIVDLPDVDWLAPETTMTRPIGFIMNFRHAPIRVGNARITIDLTGPAGVKEAFIISPRDGAGWRFVIDLQPVTHAAFMARQGMPPEAADMAAASPAPAYQPPATYQPSQPAPQPVYQPQPAPQPMAQPSPAQPAVLQMPEQATPKAQPASLPMPAARDKRGSSRRPVVVIDPGHGGVDPGATSVSGVYEKALMLTTAKQLKRTLERSGRYEVVLTRDSDIFLPLRERVARARAAGADLFLSLHANVIADPSISGLSVYTLSEKASDKEAQALADSENKADTIAGLDLRHESPEVSNILIDLAQRETMNLSAGFASDMVDELSRTTKLLRNTHRFAGFAVLKAPDVPSVLIELGYLSNDREEQLLRTAEYRAKLCDALTRSVDRYFLNVQKAQRP